MTKQRRSYTPEYKLEAASLVLEQDDSVPEAARSLGLNENVLRRWVNQLRDERLGTTPTGKALIWSALYLMLHARAITAINSEKL